MKTIATIGHSNRKIEEFNRVLVQHGVTRVVDVRRYPSSTHNPQFNKAALGHSLSRVSIAYEHIAALGGRREARDGTTKNGAWKEPAFRNYADFALTGEFQSALKQLVSHAEAEICAIMCAERNWRQCHRQIIADYLIADGWSVTHVVDEVNSEPAMMSPSAVVLHDRTILYPASQGELGLI